MHVCGCICKHTYKHTYTVSTLLWQQQPLECSGFVNENGQRDMKGRCYFIGEFCHFPIPSNLESPSSRKKGLVAYGSCGLHYKMLLFKGKIKKSIFIQNVKDHSSKLFQYGIFQYLTHE